MILGVTIRVYANHSCINAARKLSKKISIKQRLFYDEIEIEQRFSC